MDRRSFQADIGGVLGGNVSPPGDDHLVKAQLVIKIAALMRGRGLKQTEAADLFGVKQTDV